MPFPSTNRSRTGSVAQAFACVTTDHLSRLRAELHAISTGKVGLFRCHRLELSSKHPGAVAIRQSRSREYDSRN